MILNVWLWDAVNKNKANVYQLLLTKFPPIQWIRSTERIREIGRNFEMLKIFIFKKKSSNHFLNVSNNYF